MKKNIIIAFLAVVAIIMGMVRAIPVAAEGNGLSLSPMNQRIVIDPGDSYQSSFRLSNPASSTMSVEYELTVEPFYLDNSGNTSFEEVSEYNKMVDWVEFISPTKGKLEPNEVREVLFRINVPESIAAGGQYAMITVTMQDAEVESEQRSDSSSSTSKAMVKERKRLGHLVFAEVTGDVIRKGEIVNASVPSFLLSGNITGAATIKNTGNVHGDAKLTMKVFPLFSNEEVYTNEEKPAGTLVLPDREYYAEAVWEDTPAIGVFNVVFNAEFEGETVEISKMVIKMPVWLLFIILFMVAFLIITIVLRIKKSGNRRGRNTQVVSN